MTSVSRRTRTFASVAGPTNNLGDALIRRHSLAWARGDSSDPIWVYGGKAPQEWLKLMGVEETDVVVGQGRQWIWEVIKAPRNSTYFFEPGELRLGCGMLPKEVVGLSIATWIRLRGGHVVRPPRAVSGPSRVVLGVHKLGAAVSQVNLWRQEASRLKVGRGETVPDIAFWEAPYGSKTDEERALVVVSLRGKRLDPGQAFVGAVKKLAESEALLVVTAAQVEEDELRAKQLALRMGGNRLNWAPSHQEHEMALRSLYENARIVISDRLHVLVLAALAGAIPVEAVPEPSGKIASHFATVGIENISHDTSMMSEEEILAILKNALNPERNLRLKLHSARSILLNRMERIFSA